MKYKLIIIYFFASSVIFAQNAIKKVFQFGGYKITVIQNAWIDTRKSPTETIKEPIYVWLIQNENINILIDAGISPDWGKETYLPADAKPFFKKFTCRNIEEGRLDRILPQLGIALESVNYVILTHAHFDHIGGLAFFKNTKVLLSENEYKKVKLGMLGGYLPNTKNLLKNIEIIKFKKDSALANSFQESFELFKGFKIVPSYGHTAGHISVLLNKDNEYLLFTGDNEFDGTTCKNKVIKNFQSTHSVQCLGNHNEMLLTLLKPE